MSKRLKEKTQNIIKYEKEGEKGRKRMLFWVMTYGGLFIILKWIEILFEPYKLRYNLNVHLFICGYLNLKIDIVNGPTNNTGLARV